MPIITRKLEFDAGHRILKHESKCRHLHGHRYVAEITVSSLGLDELGRVIDFGVIKEHIGGWIDRHWDHNMILHPEDPLLKVYDLVCNEASILSDQILTERPPYLMSNGNPTAENMAAELFKVSELLIKDPLSIERVRLYETPNCWADHSANNVR